MRPSADQTWSVVAHVVSMRSRCSRSRVGAVIVASDGRVAATGYNGPPAAYEVSGHCDDGRWCPRAQRPEGPRSPDFSDCPSVHAEVNALLYCDRDQARGGTLYVTKPPCLACAKAIAQAGVARVVCGSPREDVDRDVLALLAFSGVELARG